MSSPFDAHNLGSLENSSVGDTNVLGKSIKAQLKDLPVHLKKHDLDLKQARKRDIKNGRHNITMSL